MASPAELSLDCKPHSYSLLLKSVGEQQQQHQHQQQTDQTQKLEEFLARLEEERLKIEAFKRELPLCMQLLNNAMEASRQQLHSYIAANQGPKPVLEQFIPLQTPNTEGSDKMMMMNHHTSDKANWMVSAQLWSQESGENLQLQSSKETESIGLKGKQITNGGGHIIPYGNHQGSEGLPELTLASSEKESEEKRNLESICRAKNVLEQGKVGNNGHADNSQAHSNNTPTANNPQTNRKARRCWSPDLHRRFVNALHMLGGSQVATPKQIRELMKVDGLTNDEVKSHLQKYRLHTRRPSPSPQGGAATGTPQLVVLGGIWVPQEYAAAAAAAHGGATAALYSPHHLTTTTHASPHYCAAPLPQDFYHGPTPPAALPPHHHQLHHHHDNQIHVYRQQQQQQPPQQSQVQSSPESDFRGGCTGGGLSESIEDGKSESGSDGENGRGGMKALMVREEREESNGSEITLKF